MFTPTSFRPTSRNLDGVSWHAMTSTCVIPATRWNLDGVSWFAMTAYKKSRISAGFFC
ncbi:MAG: hypothetical protein IKC23_09270 [Fibrobacter sp.]|nr:hypothetical protein [Fibrobacter sp.]